MNNEDQLLRDLIISNPSYLDNSVQQDKPTIISLQDTVDVIEKKYGKDWRNYPTCKCVVIWVSLTFNLEHVKEVVPDLFDLCKEYHEKRTINGKVLDTDFIKLACYVVDPTTEIL